MLVILTFGSRIIMALSLSLEGRMESDFQEGRMESDFQEGRMGSDFQEGRMESDFQEGRMESEFSRADLALPGEPPLLLLLRGRIS